VPCGRDVNSTNGCSDAARLSAGALGRILGVHGVHGRDILQLNWCAPCRLFNVVRYAGVNDGSGRERLFQEGFLAIRDISCQNTGE
jgi:hypothetical protein